MNQPDFYEILQVSSHADAEVIQAAYKRLALKYNSDHEANAEALMRQLNEAYDVLSDADRRKAYDVVRIQTTAGHVPGNPNIPKSNSDEVKPLTESGGKGALTAAKICAIGIFGELLAAVFGYFMVFFLGHTWGNEYWIGASSWGGVIFGAGATLIFTLAPDVLADDYLSTGWIIIVRSVLGIVGVIMAIVIVAYSPHKVDVEKITVYYAGGATKAEAERLGAHLIKILGHSHQTIVRLRKMNDGYQVGLLIKQERRNDQNILNALAITGAGISRDVFDGAAIKMNVCDEKGEEMTIPPRADFRYGVVDRGVEVFFATNDEREDAKRLAKYIADGYKGSQGQVIKLSRRGAIIELHMEIKQGELNDPSLLAGFRKMRQDIAFNVFNGAAVEIHLHDDIAFLHVALVLGP